MNTGITSKKSKQTNSDLEKILACFNENQNTSKSLRYPLFQAVTLAFLKENNEEIKTIIENTETRDELFLFCKYVLNSKQPDILNVISSFTSSPV